jgi:hypothetical protein
MARSRTSVFRRIALSLPEAVEQAHMKHPDFRVRGRIFATLGYPDKNWGMVVLTPQDQRELVAEIPAAFRAVKGGWGRKGCTLVRLDAVAEDMLGHALTLAWRKAARKKASGSGLLS